MIDEPTTGASYLVYEFERRAYPLSSGAFTIGRDAGSDIVIREPAVSRSHAEVRQDGEEFVLHATGATGTRVNGTAVSEPTQLTDGDRIEIGSAELTYRRGRLPLGVSVVDTVGASGHNPDAMTRRDTITNPILGAAATQPEKKKSTSTVLTLVIVLVIIVVYYVVMR